MSPLHRIQSRLFGSYLVIILLSLGSVYIAIRASVERHFEEHERLLENLEMTRMVHWLTGYHSIHDGWEGLQPYVDEMSVLFGNRIVVVGVNGVIVADSRTDSSEPNLSRTWPSRPLQYSPEDQSVGTLYVGSELTIQETFRTRLEGSIRSFLVLGFAVAVGAAIALSAAAARRLAAPVRLLAESAARAGAGDLTVRVDVAERGELGLLAHAFNTMIEELQRATTVRRNLVADTAHELRTPLSNIRGYVEALRDGVLPSESALPIIEEEVSLIVRLVDDLQDLAIAESGMLQLQVQRIHAASAVRLAVAAIAPDATRRHVCVRVEATESAYVAADAHRLQQMLLNLLKNALKFTPSHSVVLVSVTESDSRVRIRVTDSGPGIPPEDLKHVFDRFYRVDPSRSRSTGGSGLGLTITRHLAEAHEGTLHAESTPGVGSSFTVELPADPSDVDPGCRKI